MSPADHEVSGQRAEPARGLDESGECARDEASGASERIRRNIAKARVTTAPYRARMRTVRDGEAAVKAAQDAARQAEKDKKQALEDVFWAILNSREFMFNH